MKYYMAPMESVTTYVYRKAYHKYFQPMDCYYTPFIVPHTGKRFNTRELKELSPEYNAGLHVVPQLLTNHAEDFLHTAKLITDMGYHEMNLNLGCPSKTVVTKKKGSGLLAYPEELDAFLYQIFERADFDISVKTRIGKENPEEFYRLIEIYNKYPIKELIIHPRLQTDYYQNTPNMEVFQMATKECKHALCYNGDLNSVRDIYSFCERFPDVPAVMLGRGLVANPGLVSLAENKTCIDKKRLYAFHQEILEEYIHISCGDKNVLFKMKELWFYMISMFEDAKKHAKKIKKSQRVDEYEAIIRDLFDSCELRKEEY